MDFETRFPSYVNTCWWFDIRLVCHMFFGLESLLLKHLSTTAARLMQRRRNRHGCLRRHFRMGCVFRVMQLLELFLCVHWTYGIVHFGLCNTSSYDLRYIVIVNIWAVQIGPLTWRVEHVRVHAARLRIVLFVGNLLPSLVLVILWMVWITAFQRRRDFPCKLFLIINCRIIHIWWIVKVRVGILLYSSKKIKIIRNCVTRRDFLLSSFTICKKHRIITTIGASTFSRTEPFYGSVWKKS